MWTLRSFLGLMLMVTPVSARATEPNVDLLEGYSPMANCDRIVSGATAADLWKAWLMPFSKAQRQEKAPELLFSLDGNSFHVGQLINISPIGDGVDYARLQPKEKGQAPLMVELSKVQSFGLVHRPQSGMLSKLFGNAQANYLEEVRTITRFVSGTDVFLETEDPSGKKDWMVVRVERISSSEQDLVFTVASEEMRIPLQNITAFAYSLHPYLSYKPGPFALINEGEKSWLLSASAPERKTIGDRNNEADLILKRLKAGERFDYWTMIEHYQRMKKRVQKTAMIYAAANYDLNKTMTLNAEIYDLFDLYDAIIVEAQKALKRVNPNAKFPVP